MLIEYKKFAENQDYEDFVVEINQLEQQRLKAQQDLKAKEEAENLERLKAVQEKKVDQNTRKQGTNAGQIVEDDGNDEIKPDEQPTVNHVKESARKASQKDKPIEDLRNLTQEVFPDV